MLCIHGQGIFASMLRKRIFGGAIACESRWLDVAPLEAEPIRLADLIGIAPEPALPADDASRERHYAGDWRNESAPIISGRGRQLAAGV